MRRGETMDNLIPRGSAREDDLDEDADNVQISEGASEQMKCLFWPE